VNLINNLWGKSPGKANVLVGDAAMIVYISGVENKPIADATNSVEQSPGHEVL
jgi:hypothetical protein